MNRAKSPIFRLRAGRSVLAVVIFLCAFFALLIVVSQRFLYPAADAAKQATTQGRHELAAISALILALLLLTLFVGLWMTFGIGRFFFPRRTAPRYRTSYLDAWEEAGRRLQVPPEETDGPDDMTDDA